jgi:hypothetical protein
VGTIPSFIEKLKHQDPDVRDAAAHALCKLAEKGELWSGTDVKN